MFSTTLKQSVATLGVVAGLLAAAGPASAGGPSWPRRPASATSEYEVEPDQAIGGVEAAGFVKAPAKTWTDGNNQPWDGGSYRQGATLGTQVGSEGVKDDVPLETVSFTIKGAAFRGEVIGLEPTVKAPANAMSTGISGQEMSMPEAPASPTPEVFTSVSN